MDTSTSSDKVDETFTESATEEIQATEQEETNSKYLQVEDSTLDHLPKHVEQLLNKLPSKSQTDLLIGLIYCIAVETGFADIQSISTESTSTEKSSITTATTTASSTSIDDYSYFWGFSFNLKFSKNILQMIPNYQDLTTQNHNLYKLKLNLINFSVINCLLVGIQTGEYLIVTLTVDKLSGRSICLSIPRYVLSQKSINIKPNLFRNLKELSYLLKEKIFIPTRNTLMEESNKLYPGLNGLPIELLNIILKYVNITQLQNLSKTCWKMRCCCVDYYELIYTPLKNPYGSKSGGNFNINKTTRVNRPEPSNVFHNSNDGLNVFHDPDYIN